MSEATLRNMRDMHAALTYSKQRGWLEDMSWEHKGELLVLTDKSANLLAQRIGITVEHAGGHVVTKAQLQQGVVKQSVYYLDYDFRYTMLRILAMAQALVNNEGKEDDYL